MQPCYESCNKKVFINISAASCLNVCKVSISKHKEPEFRSLQVKIIMIFTINIQKNTLTKEKLKKEMR